MEWICVVGVAAALLVLTGLCVRGVNVYVGSIAAAAIVALFSQTSLQEVLVNTYASGFAKFLGQYLFLFILGSVYGKLMDITGAARTVANCIIRIAGRGRGLLACSLAVGALAYGGINGYIAIFASLPILTQVFREENIPRRFIPALYLFGAGTFANAGPGSPQILNIICTSAVGLSPMAGAVPGFIGSGIIFLVGLFWLSKMVSRAKNLGEQFVVCDTDSRPENQKSLHPLQAFAPIVTVIVAINLKIDGSSAFSLEGGMLLGCGSVLLCCCNTVPWKEFVQMLGDSCQNAISMVGSVCAMVGFGSVVSASPAFAVIVDLAAKIPGPPVLTLAVAMNLMCAATATASGAAGIIAPVLGPLYVGMGVDPNVVARVMAISATGFDSVPYNGTIVAIIHDICHETHRSAYGPVFRLCVVTPLIGTAAVILACLVLY